MPTWGTGSWGTSLWGGTEGTEAEPVPVDPNSTGAVSAAERFEQRSLGTDILFNGDYAVGQNGDYVLLSGLENLRQAIYRRLMTKPGEYKFVPEYGVGVPLWLKRKRTPAILKQLETAVRENLLREQRIEQVVDVSIENIENGIKVNVAVKASGRFLRFSPLRFEEV